MDSINLPDIEYLRQCFDYNPETGDLIWKDRPRDHFTTHRSWKSSNARLSGKTAGKVRVRPNGYASCQVEISGTKYLTHRVAFAIYHGREPGPVVDHINRNPLDNRIVNLRDASISLNNQNNLKPQKNSSTGIRGISIHRGTNKWQADIAVRGKKKYLGLFDTPEQAHAAYLQAKEKYHPGAVIA